MLKISNVGLAQLVVIELEGAVSFNAILADIDADRTRLWKRITLYRMHGCLI